MSYTEYTIKYYYGSYSGTESVIVDDRERHEVDPIERMWWNLQRKGYLDLSVAAQGAKVIDERYYSDEDE